MPVNKKVTKKSVEIHPTAVVDKGAQIGDGTKVWHFCHISATAVIGENCTLGQNVYIGPWVVIGNRVRIQNNVSVYEGTKIGDDAFLGPSCVITNVHLPKAALKKSPEPVWIGERSMIGANCTIISPCDIGPDVVVGAGSVVTHSIEAGAIVWGNPAKVQ